MRAPWASCRKCWVVTQWRPNTCCCSWSAGALPLRYVCSAPKRTDLARCIHKSGAGDVCTNFPCIPDVLACRVHHRTADSAVGVLSLNLITDEATSAAQQQQPRPADGQEQLSPLGAALGVALEALAPRCRTLALSVDALNRRPWWPRRDQNSQRLISGPLQLASYTQVCGHY